MDLALNNVQRLICYKTQTTNQPTPLRNVEVSCACQKTTFGGEASVLEV